jgi:4-hydroxyproline epimerase
MAEIKPGEHRIETPVGVVTATLHQSGEVTVNNVASYRNAAGVLIEVPGYRKVRGDVAWGGNWFFLIEDHGFELTFENVERLTEFTWAVRRALNAAGITGDDGHEIDHIELFGPSKLPGVNSKNFVLACLFADGELREGEVWRQESIVGSVFEGRVEIREGRIYPSITGSAFVNSEAELLLDPRDPFCNGIRA